MLTGIRKNTTGIHHNNDQRFQESEMLGEQTFYVRAPSTSAVRRALFRAPGGARVVGRHDRETILCTHTMDEHSLARLWPIILSRLAKAGLAVVPRPQARSAGDLPDNRQFP